MQGEPNLQNQNQNYVSYQSYTPRPMREFSSVESGFAWLALIAGYAFCRVFPVMLNPFGGLIFVIALFAVTTAVLKKRGAKFGVMSVAAMLSAVIVSFSLFFSSNGFIHFLSYGYAAVAYCYFVYASFGNALEKGFSNLIAADFFKALFVMPFVSMGQVFPALGSGKGKKRGKAFLKILLGLALAFIPTAIVVSLLSYDSGFTSLLQSIFKFDFRSIVSHLFSIAFGIPVGMYIYGGFISSVDKKCSEALTADSWRNAVQKARIVPSVTALAAALPLLVLYVIFFISQWKYYVSGFVGVLPDEVSYAEYAREGFFQLCAVSVINLLVISAFGLFMRRRQDGKSVLLKVLSLVFSVFTLVLISTAMAKMALYINRYGLTPKRVYSSWFMVVLAVVFLLVCAKQIAPKFKLIPTAFFVSVAMFAFLAISGVDGLIAKYNVDRYLGGSLETVDVAAMEQLGDSAVPQLVRLAKELDRKNDTSIAHEVEYIADMYDENADSEFSYYIYEGTAEFEWQLYEQVADALARYVSNAKERSVFSLTLPHIRAKAALSSAGIALETVNAGK